MHQSSDLFDCIILGAGPAGLAAGVYMGRYLRPTLILNHPKPLTRWHRPTAHNVLGFPSGIHRNQLLEWGRAHVAKYQCVQFHSAAITRLAAAGEQFQLSDAAGATYHSRGLIIAVGIEHALPDLPGIMHYAGYTIWHCPDCDGFKCLHQPVAVIGNDRGSADMALGLTVWTKQVMLCLNGQQSQLDPEAEAKLKEAGIPVLPQKIRALAGDAAEGILAALELQDGPSVPVCGAFVNPRPAVEDALFSQLGLTLHGGGWIRVDHRMRTNVPRCYAAGDIVAHAQTQLSVAMGTGATAAIWLHKELLPPAQCLSGRDWSGGKDAP